MSVSPQNKYTVAIVDDSETDRLLLRKVIEQFPRFQLITELRDGDEAIQYLSRNGRFKDSPELPVPDLLLLDLNMPRVDGRGVLGWLQTHSIPSLTVIVLSDSTSENDAASCITLGAAGFWTKTSDPELQKIIALEVDALLDARARSLRG